MCICRPCLYFVMQTALAFDWSRVNHKVVGHFRTSPSVLYGIQIIMTVAERCTVYPTCYHHCSK